MTFASIQSLKEIIETDDVSDFQCASCEFQTTNLHVVNDRSEDGRNTRTLCDICYSTHAGNAIRYPSQYRESREIMKMLAYCTNVILEARK